MSLYSWKEVGFITAREEETLVGREAMRAPFLGPKPKAKAGVIEAKKEQQLKQNKGIVVEGKLVGKIVVRSVEGEIIWLTQSTRQGGMV